MLQLRQLFDKESSTYTYLLYDDTTTEAILIDPVLEQCDRDLTLINELGLKLKLALDTHVHADHISALGKLRQSTRCQTGMSAQSGASCADVQLKEGDSLSLGTHSLSVISTPGHTNGCLTYRIGNMIFTGDALLVRGCGRTDFQEGSAERLYESVVGKLFPLPNDTVVYPAHDYRGFTRTTIAEERLLNPRLTKTKAEFIEFMKNLKLPDPKMMMAAVPLNLHCGGK